VSLPLSWHPIHHKAQNSQQTIWENTHTEKGPKNEKGNCKEREREREREREHSLCYIFLLCRLEDYPSPEKQEASKLVNTTRKP
jgi:hypothetical protein